MGEGKLERPRAEGMLEKGQRWFGPGLGNNSFLLPFSLSCGKVWGKGWGGSRWSVGAVSLSYTGNRAPLAWQGEGSLPGVGVEGREDWQGRAGQGRACPDLPLDLSALELLRPRQKLWADMCRRQQKERGLWIQATLNTSCMPAV